MAQHVETSQAPRFRQRLEETLREPEPMCLAMVRINLADTFNSGPATHASSDPIRVDEIMAAVQSRLTHQLRRYDLMARVEDDMFMLVVKTLADTRVLDARMYQLYGSLSAPYTIRARSMSVSLALGAAVRLPSESAGSLIRRADRALAVATEAGGKAPVLI